MIEITTSTFIFFYIKQLETKNYLQVSSEYIEMLTKETSGQQSTTLGFHPNLGR